MKAWQAYRAECGLPAAPTCPACGDLGWLRLDVPADDPQFGKLERCGTCTNGAQLAWIAAHCGLRGDELTRRLSDWRSGTWVQAERRQQRQDALAALVEALGERNGFLTFWGDFGAGKTLALQIVVNELRLLQIETFYAPFALVLDHLRSLFRQGEESSHFWQRLLDIPALALDEVTRFSGTDWAQERLWLLADTRYRRIGSHLTLFATNDDPRTPLPTSEPVGYLYSRMRQGRLVELRGDMREVAR